MGLLAYCWRRLTGRLLGGSSVAKSGGYVVVEADTHAEVAEALSVPAYRDPVETLRQIEDNPNDIWVWEVGEESARTALMRALENNGVEEMDALHVCLSDREQLSQFDADDLRPYVDASLQT